MIVNYWLFASKIFKYCKIVQRFLHSFSYRGFKGVHGAHHRNSAQGPPKTLLRHWVRWMCGVSLKDRKRSEDLCNLLGINCVADVVRRGRLRWFGHLECKSVDDWVSSCRRLVVEGARGQGRSRKTWEQCVKDDMELLGLHSERAIFRDVWRDLIWGKRLL